jgi:nucleoside-diphosphate-sugar epimerase
MERVLVTGAGGYIGTTLTPLLLEDGYQVRAIDRFFFGRDLLEDHPNLEVIQEDVRRLSPDHFDEVDYVIDLAAISNDPSGELFQTATRQINHHARVRTATMAKAAGARRYVLPSSCSIYGFQDKDVIVDETDPTNPLTTYAKSNEAAENDILSPGDEHFCVVALRQATVYGYSPRMRFDLAINGMTYGAWKNGALPLMRDGTQWRPMVHVQDTSRAQMFMLTADRDAINRQVFNVGSDDNNYQIGPLAEQVISVLPGEVAIEWYGDPDVRSYRVSFAKIEQLGFKAEYMAEDGARDVVEALEAGLTDRTTKTLTLDWYKQLTHWNSVLDDVTMHGGLIDLPESEQ